MPPARRQLRALGSLQLVGYANNPAKVITELAFITDERTNALATEGGECDVNAPLEVQFNDFVDGVNSRGKGTKNRQRKMTNEQAAAVLLVMVQKGHVELITKEGDPHTIGVIKILPEAKRMLATFLPKLRGYGDIPYDQQYRGAIALAKRHFFPKGKAPTKKELMELLLQSYQERRKFSLGHQIQPRLTKTLSIQTSLLSIDPSAHIKTASANIGSVTCPNMEEPPNNNVALDVGSTSVAPEASPDLDSYDLALEPGIVPDQPVDCTPVVPRSFNPYMTPISNPRHGEYAAVAPSLLDASPTPAADTDAYLSPEEDSVKDDGMGELLQATATSRGRLNYYYGKFKAACQKITSLEGQKEAIQRNFNVTQRQLDETERRLREANADRGRLNKWVDKLLRQVDLISGQLDLLRRMAAPDAIDNEDWFVYDPGFPEGFDPSST